jgi:hypothetical protein
MSANSSPVMFRDTTVFQEPDEKNNFFLVKEEYYLPNVFGTLFSMLRHRKQRS